eukprot:204939-Alexandrium_andersonii.AAC.1
MADYLNCRASTNKIVHPCGLSGFTHIARVHAGGDPMLAVASVQSEAAGFHRSAKLAINSASR